MSFLMLYLVSFYTPRGTALPSAARLSRSGVVTLWARGCWPWRDSYPTERSLASTYRISGRSDRMLQEGK